jgi:hypothetical protein
VIALSSCEAEYIACAYAACQYIWLQSLLKDIRIELTGPIQLFVDNKYAINLAINPISHGRSNHIKTRFHFIKVNKGRIELSHCPTEKQKDDIKRLRHRSMPGSKDQNSSYIPRPFELRGHVVDIIQMVVVKLVS